MSPGELVIQIERRGGTFALEDGELRCRVPKGAVSAELAATLRHHQGFIAKQWATLPADCLCHGACVQLGPCDRSRAGRPCRSDEVRR